jgi:hypothetical protein
MSKYFVGELGYEHDAEFIDKNAAENAAIEHSIATGLTAISIWNEHDEVISIVVEGEIFDKRKSCETSVIKFTDAEIKEDLWSWNDFQDRILEEEKQALALGAELQKEGVGERYGSNKT